MDTGATHFNREHSHLPFLDALRGLMAVWVLAGHTLRASGGSLPLLSTPGRAVDIFMLVSGFLMAYYFRIREDKEAWESPRTWQAFYIRRFFRIAPAYYAVLLVALIFRNPLQTCAYQVLSAFPLSGASGEHVLPVLAPLHWADILTHLTFTFGFIPQYASSTPLPDWSIGLEMQFYLALPFIMLLYRRAGHLLSTLLLIAVWAAANHFIGVGPGVAPKVLGHFPMAAFLPLKLNCFVVGILLAESLYFKDRNARKSAMLCLFAFAVAGATSTRILTASACLSALLLIYRGESAPFGIRAVLARVQRALRSRPCAFLADTSYGVYLLHVLAVWPLGAWLALHPTYLRLPANERFFLFLGAMLSIVYPIAWLLHKFVEQPGIKLGKQFIRHHRRASQIVTTPVRKGSNAAARISGLPEASSTIL